MSFRNTTYRIFLVGTLLWCVAILLPPFANYWGNADLSSVAYGFFSRICHQLDSHSLHLFDTKLAVCSRCSAIYAGFFLGVLFCPFAVGRRWIPKLRKLAPLSILPLLLDVLFSITGLHESTATTRVLTGLTFGIPLPSLLLIPADEALKELKLKLSSSLHKKMRYAK